MAGSATPRPAEPPAAAQRGGFDIAVAFSGGLDSTALLHATARSSGGRRVLALHVNHGLQAASEAWEAHCRAQAAALGVGFASVQLTGKPAPGESIEAWARAGRHAALQAMSLDAGADLLLLAHHRCDQAETWLLQAMRGAGLAGQAAMPAAQWRDGVCWARPWLAQPRERIEAYAHEHGLRWIEDPSNADPRYARNALRQHWAAFAEAEAGLAQSAVWAQQALQLAEEVAEADLAVVAPAGALDLAAWARLTPARASNVLRAWLAEQVGSVPASLVQRLTRELAPAASARWPAPGGWLEAYRGQLHWRPQLESLQGTERLLDLSQPGRYTQPDWGGVWRVTAVAHGGVPAECLRTLRQHARAGGEQFQSAPRSTARALKKAYQSAALSASQRGGPLLSLGEQLLYAPGLGLDARACALPGEPRCLIEWQADPDLPQGEGAAGPSE